MGSRLLKSSGGELEIKNDPHFSGERPDNGRLGRGIQAGSKFAKDARKKLANTVKSYQVKNCEALYPNFIATNAKTWG